MSKCNNCAYKVSVPTSSHHISCRFNWIKSELNSPTVNQHGVKEGWYYFPLNFDPVWQTEECKAFSSIKDEEMYLDEVNFLLSLFNIF